MVLFLSNVREAARDLRTSAGFTVTYSSTAEMFIQLRGTVQRDGGNQYHAVLPATAGAMMKRSVRFVRDDWTFRLGATTQMFTDVLRTAVLFNFISMPANDVTIYDIRFDNYVPACP
jgi:hypothetical protein